MQATTSGELVVRRVQLSDLKAIHEIDSAAFGGIANDFVTIRQMYDTAAECFFVGEVDSALVAYAVGCGQFGSDSGWLLDVAVHPSKQGLGYGKRLTMLVIETLVKAGISSIRLVVQPENNAVRLYESLGFSEEIREQNYYGTGERMIMRRTGSTS